jgi:hypothetical protein
MSSDHIKKNWAFVTGVFIAPDYLCYFLLSNLNGGFRDDDSYKAKFIGQITSLLLKMGNLDNKASGRDIQTASV